MCCCMPLRGWRKNARCTARKRVAGYESLKKDLDDTGCKEAGGYSYQALLPLANFAGQPPKPLQRIVQGLIEWLRTAQTDERSKAL